MSAIAIIAIVTGSITLLSTLVGCTWYLGGRLGNIQTAVETIKSNDLEHIYARLGSIEEYLRGE